MSRITNEKDIHPRTISDICMNRLTNTTMYKSWACGCGEKASPVRFMLCDYHEGYDDAIHPKR